MPDPRPGESRDDFLDRCIPQVIEEGKEPDQAVAMCVSYYEGYKDKAFDIKDDDRIEYWKAFDRRRESFDAKYTRVFSKAIRKQLEIYEDAQTVQDFRAEIKEEPIKDAIVELYSEVGSTFARLTWEGIKSNLRFETKQEQPDWINRMTEAVVISMEKERIVAISSALRDEIRKIVTIGLEEGLSIEEIKRRIIGTTSLQPLNGTLQQRARRIARTEIVSASNYGSLTGAESTNIPGLKKQWLSTPDDRTRDTHLPSNTQDLIVDLQADFVLISGARLQFPGDPSADASEVINCRCTQIYITPES